jgi:hypothetical protein
MTFNTAILYDIENLIGGYNKAGYLSELSLKDIFDEIKKRILMGLQFSVHMLIGVIHD